MRILIGEDEKELLDLLAKRLKKEGYSVDGCEDGVEVLAYLEDAPYDLLILDIMMPKKDGFTVLKELRKKKLTTPVMLLTAKDAISDRVAGLDMGADEYMTKPFAFDELLARIRMLLRRHSSDKSDVLEVGDLWLSVSTHQVKRAGQDILLSAKEFALLECLMRNRNLPLTRSQLESHIYDFGFEGGSNVIDVYMRYLRKKLDDPFEKKLIHTLRGIGYMIKDKEA